MPLISIQNWEKLNRHGLQVRGIPTLFRNQTVPEMASTDPSSTTPTVTATTSSSGTPAEPSSPKLDLDLNGLLLIALHASWALDDADGERMLNWLANELEEQMGISREDLKRGFDKIGITLWDPKEEEESEEEGEPEYGACGFRCDGHCQTCDPGYLDRMRYGSYDGRDEI